MTNLKELGQLLRLLREKAGRSMQEAASGLSVDRSYLSKIERGRERPSIELLNKINALYSPEPTDFARLNDLSGYRKNIEHTTRKEESKMSEEQSQINTQRELEVEIPQSMDILYCDSVFITSSKFGVILNFAQTTPAPNKQKVISRIGMSKDHCQAFMKALQDNLMMSGKLPVPAKKILS